MKDLSRKNGKAALWTVLALCFLACGGVGAAWAAEAPPLDRPFPDVPRDHWAYEAVEELRQLGILRGYPAAPATAVGRATQKPAPPARTGPAESPSKGSARPAPQRPRRR